MQYYAQIPKELAFGLLVMLTITNIFHLLRFRRFKTAHDIPETYFKHRRILYGDVVHVGDADGFRFVHRPWGYFGSSDGIQRGGTLLMRCIIV